MTIREIFEQAENGVLTAEQFAELAKGAKFVDLNEGNYVSRRKYDDDIKAKTTEIESLNGTITARDTDLEDLRKQLEAAGTDADKLTELSGQFTTLQGKYDADTKALQDKLSKQAYEFAVKEFASTKKFTSNAAKRDFINSMIAENLKMDKKGTGIIGAEDFVTSYSADNADAFVVDNPTPTPPEPPKPTFVNPTPGGDPSPIESNAFANAFHFTGVRTMPSKGE